MVGKLKRLKPGGVEYNDLTKDRINLNESREDFWCWRLSLTSPQAIGYGEGVAEHAQTLELKEAPA